MFGSFGLGVGAAASSWMEVPKTTTLQRKAKTSNGMSMMLPTLLSAFLLAVLLLAAGTSEAFGVGKCTRIRLRSSPRSLFMSRVSFENLSTVPNSYKTRVEKPLGVIFSDNPDPYFGLVVDEIETDMNGANAGLKVGDQLLAVNGESVVGDEFDYVLDFLKVSKGTLELQLYRGTVRSLYTTLENMNVLQDDDTEDEEEVVMDENYESPVRIEVEEEKPLSPGDIFNGLKNIATKLSEKDESYVPKQEKKESKGLFGGMFSGETIQLEGDDAKGLKRQPRNKN